MATNSAKARPLGPVVPSREAILPQHKTFHGQHTTLRPLTPADADSLFPLISGDENAYLWDYLPSGPFSKTDLAAFAALVSQQSESTDPLFWAIVVGEKAVGWCSLLRITPSHGVAEVGHILFTKKLQRTPAATEALFLLANHVFEQLGYRRLEWKCNDLNEPSKRAAVRLGLRWEGLFRQHMVVKGRNRDTAWFAMVDGDWFGAGGENGGYGGALRQWLSEDNFGEDGVQRRRLEDVRGEV